MSVSQTAPSPFAALLRRSKFASYDPSIGQVYTTHGGHAHRGNWGLKRPLPNRRRNGFITIRNVDSREQQTEWNSAENSARWMRRWEAIGKVLKVEESGPWGSKSFHLSWSVDSEFNKGGKPRFQPPKDRQEREENVMDARNIIPNPDAMSPKQFEKYLRRLRALRPEFKAFLKKSWAELEAKKTPGPKVPSENSTLKLAGTGEIDMYASAQGPTETYVTKFLMDRAKDEFYTPESRRIEQRPHRFAGLEYTYMSALQSQYLHKPVPGRDIAANRGYRWVRGSYLEKYDLVAVGGIVGALRERGHTLYPTDFGTREAQRTDRERGKGVFRMSNVVLVDVPSVVGRVPQRADQAMLRAIEFRTTQMVDANRSNPHPLGSAEYVGEQGITTGKGAALLIPAGVQNLTRKVLEPPPRKNESDRARTFQLLDSLKVMIEKSGN